MKNDEYQEPIEAIVHGEDVVKLLPATREWNACSQRSVREECCY